MTVWAVDPQTGHGIPLSDAAGREAAAEGWSVYQYDSQDAGMSGLGIDPNANAPHQITADKVLVYNANTQRYEWMSRALVDAQNAATNAYGAETQRAATAADIIAASRGPENAFQYSNALHGQPDAAGVGIFDALAGRLGAPTTTGTPAQGDLHPIDIMGKVQAILNRSFGTGGENGSGSSAWADAAGMAPTQTEQRAQGVAQDASQAAQEGQQTAADTPGGRTTYPWQERPIALGGGTDAPAAGWRPGTVYSPEMGRWVDGTGGAQTGAYTPNPMGRADAQMQGRAMTAYGPSSAVYDAFSGKVDTGAYERASGLSGSGDSDIAWKNKSHQLIEGRGYGHGSDARNAAHKAAGMTGEEFDRVVKHGGDPFKQKQVSAAEGMLDVITGPTTIHAGEGGKDEIHIVIPMERADQPVPRALLALANQMSPDLDQGRGVGGVTDGMALHKGGGPLGPFGPPEGPNPIYQGQTGQSGSAFDPDYLGTPPHNLPHYVPTTVPGLNKGGPIHMAAGGGLAVIGGPTTVKQANSAPDAAGQVTAPYKGRTRQFPVSQTTRVPNFGSIPPALLSLISPSDWQLIGSQFGAAGGNAADIPFLLQRGTRGLGQAPARFGGRVFA